jgi:hypothetical protein
MDSMPLHNKLLKSTKNYAGSPVEFITILQINNPVVDESKPVNELLYVKINEVIYM